MSAPTLSTAINPDSESYRANSAHNRALRDELWAKVAEAALGGNEKSRERHVSRGKLLPRERVERLLDLAVELWRQNGGKHSRTVLEAVKGILEEYHGVTGDERGSVVSGIIGSLLLRDSFAM